MVQETIEGVLGDPIQERNQECLNVHNVVSLPQVADLDLWFIELMVSIGYCFFDARSLYLYLCDTPVDRSYGFLDPM